MQFQKHYKNNERQQNFYFKQRLILINMMTINVLMTQYYMKVM